MQIAIMSGGRIPAPLPKKNTALQAPPTQPIETPVQLAPFPTVQPPQSSNDSESPDTPPWDSSGLDDLAAKFGNIVQFTEE